MKTDHDFYSAAAQVIPVLLITLAIEYRMFAAKDTEPASESLFLLAVLLMLTVAEVVPLAVLLDSEDPTTLDRVVVIAALGFALVGIVEPLARRPIEALATTLPAFGRI